MYENIQLAKDVAWATSKDAAKKTNAILVELFRDITTRLNPNLFLEFGARQADFTWEMSRLLPSTEFICIEANPFSHSKYSARFDGKPNVRYLNFAISEKNGIAEIKIPNLLAPNDLTKGNASLATRSAYDGDYTTRSVPSMRLDDFLCSHMSKSICAWIDVEGYLRQVLEGATKSLEMIDAAFIEVEESPFWDNQLLDVEVFEIMQRNNFIPIARDREYSKQYNVIFVKKNKIQQIKSEIYSYANNLHEAMKNHQNSAQP